ncbi:phospholipase C/P1 nuclease domain-containing protein [Mycena epipterygia]|nr:phospholipase C/P1 nuclease domain-containing protein [Mycena epipterygia]
MLAKPSFGQALQVSARSLYHPFTMEATFASQQRRHEALLSSNRVGIIAYIESHPRRSSNANPHFRGEQRRTDEQTPGAHCTAQSHTGACYAVHPGDGTRRDDSKLRRVWPHSIPFPERTTKHACDPQLHIHQPQYQCHLAPVATWADKLHYKMRWSAPLHLHRCGRRPPVTNVRVPRYARLGGKQGGNVFGAIRNVTNTLEGSVPYGASGRMSASQYDVANEALKFLIHLMGDIHMPLHFTGRDRGGNSDKVLFSGRQTHLYSLWNGLLIAKTLRSLPRKYSRLFPHPRSNTRSAARSTTRTQHGHVGRRLGQAVFVWHRVLGVGMVDTDDDLICPYYWATPIHALNCAIVWPKALDEPPYNSTRLDGASTAHHDSASEPTAELAQVDRSGQFVGGAVGRPYLELDTPEYSGVISKEWIVEKLLAQAGIRLAGVLNYLFADFEEAEEAELWRSGLRIDF